MAKKFTKLGSTDEAFEAGKKAEYDRFWDDFQQNGSRTDYTSAFGSQWTSETWKPKYPVRPVMAYYMFFTNSSESMAIPDFVQFCNENNLILDFSNTENASYGLAALHTNHLGVLDFSKCTSLSHLFYSHSWISSNTIRVIDEFRSSEITVFANTTFQNAIYLTEITMTGIIASNGLNLQWSPNLNKASIESIINTLSTTTSGLTVTLSQTAVNNAFTTDEWNTFIATKPNWTISLM